MSTTRTKQRRARDMALIAISLLAVTVAIVACDDDDDDDDTVCVYGQRQDCECDDGSTGYQTCNPDGTGWGTCEGCGSTGDCEPGESRACTCSDGAEGTQTCSSDEEWGECLCDALCTDADDDGYPAESGCEQERDCNDDDASVHPGAEEVCDGVDNNCDGSIDPGCACEEGDTQPCGETDEGECRLGVQACTDGAWGLCEGSLGPTNERCDGLDNDCDGTVDNDVPTVGQQCVVSGQVGICAVGELECSGGVESCAQVNTPTDEICNLLDDDCDGSVDEDNPEGGDACLVSGVYGPCQVGELVCSSGTLSCGQTVFPVEETCDGTDENCDGLIDNRAPPLEPCTCSDGHSIPCGTDEGECVAGTDTCTDGVYPGCSGTYVGPEVEVCDGLDNDCDGVVDNGDPGGGASCTVSSAHGPCADGVERCVDGSVTCVQVVSPVAELCNGVDDDCDGTVDDGNPGGGGSCVVSGESGPCRDGVDRCVDGELTCEQTVFPGSETSPASNTCNSVDDDCNGVVDDDCGCTPSATRVCGWNDVGECTYGTETCSATGSWGDCDGAVMPTAEVCDGRDNDCDGRDDDGDPEGGGSCTASGEDGICADGTRHCVGGHVTCQPGTAEPESCDGLDNDCDGETDESGNYPDADEYEFNDGFIFASDQGSFMSRETVLSPESALNFHIESDVDCFVWSYSIVLAGAMRFWSCRPTGLDSTQDVDLWLGVGSNSMPGHPDIASSDFSDIANEAVVASSFITVAGHTDIPPFQFWVCVDQDSGWGPCFNSYDIECKLSDSASW